MKTILLFVVSMFIGAAGFFIIYKKPAPQSTEKVAPVNVTSVPTTSTFNIQNAPNKSLKGTIISYEGDVGWQSRTATESATLTKLIDIQQGEELTTGETSKVSVQFPELLVKISPNTKLSFSQTLPEKFVFYQPSGTVGYTKTNDNLLSVRSMHLLTQFKKGSYVIMTNSETHIITIDCQEGSGTVAFNDSQNQTTIKEINAGKQITFDDDNRLLSVK
jgi:hypothetical protein